MLTLWRRRLKNKRRRVSLDAALRGKMLVEIQRLARLEKKIIDKNQNAFMKLKRMMKSMCYAPIHGKEKQIICLLEHIDRLMKDDKARHESYLLSLKSQKADTMKVISTSPTQKQIIRELKRTLKSFARDLENGMACSEEEERDLVKKIGSNANRSLRLNYKYKKIAKHLDDEIEKCEIFISGFILCTA